MSCRACLHLGTAAKDDWSLGHDRAREPTSPNGRASRTATGNFRITNVFKQAADQACSQRMRLCSKLASRCVDRSMTGHSVNAEKLQLSA